MTAVRCGHPSPARPHRGGHDLRPARPALRCRGHATRIIDASRRARSSAFDAVWVRDHLLWKPHGMEGTDRTFIEPLAALTSIAAATSRIHLGTAVLIPLRWPLKLAQDLAAMSYLDGGRVIAGLGMGSIRRAGGRRVPQADASSSSPRWRRSSDGSGPRTTSPSRASSSSSRRDIEPKPPEPIPIWYGGTHPRRSTTRPPTARAGCRPDPDGDARGSAGPDRRAGGQGSPPP